MKLRNQEKFCLSKYVIYLTFIIVYFFSDKRIIYNYIKKTFYLYDLQAFFFLFNNFKMRKI